MVGGLIFGGVVVVSTIMMILFLTNKGMFHQNDEPDFMDFVKQDPDVISAEHKITVSYDWAHFEDPLGLGKSGILDGTKSLWCRDFEEASSGWNISYKNKYGTVFDYELIGYFQYSKLGGKGRAFYQRDIFSYKPVKKISSTFVVVPSEYFVEGTFVNCEIEEIESDNVAFNETYTTAILNPIDKKGESEEEDFFYSLTPQVIERMCQLYKIFGKHLLYIFMHDRVFFVLGIKTFLTARKMANKDTLELMKHLANLFDLENPINEEDIQCVRTFMKGHKRIWGKGEEVH